MEQYSIGEMAKKLGKSVKTLQRWDKNGTLSAFRHASNRRYYTQKQFLEASNRVNYIKDGTDLDAVRNKTVLITGATGSLGTKLTARICTVAKKIIVFSRCELKQANMQAQFSDKDNIRYMLGDIKDKERLDSALDGVDVCVHAACFKRIDSCSYNPFEAIKTNINGSVNVAEACIKRQVKKVIFVSTDKATESGTLYGGTKFVAEQMFINANNYSSRNSTIFSIVRYGNVYGSNGSVRHIFEKQAEENGVIGITHPEMTRFFMSLDDACDLVLFCANGMIGGEIYVPKMKSIEIVKYAEIFAPNTPIKIIGLRGHEKIHEKLISETEMLYVVKCNEKYYKIIPPHVNIPGLGWDVNYPEEKKTHKVTLSSNTAERFTNQEIMKFECDLSNKDA